MRGAVRSNKLIFFGQLWATNPEDLLIHLTLAPHILLPLGHFMVPSHVRLAYYSVASAKLEAEDDEDDDA